MYVAGHHVPGIMWHDLAAMSKLIKTYCLPEQASLWSDDYTAHVCDKMWFLK